MTMLVDLYGKLIREQRARRGLTQAALAGKARVSRAILSRLEQRKPVPVQSDTLDRLLAALEVQPALDAAARDAARRLARLEQEVRRGEQRERHLRLALELAAGGAAAKAKVAKARERVSLWRAKKTCSPFYIERWSKLLAKPPRVLAREMSSLGEWEDALFQNTPWSWAWT